MSEKAIVLEAKNKKCTVITSGGDFREVRLKGQFRPGQQITLPRQSRGLYRYALAAACLAFLIITGGLLEFWSAPAVAAYVCLDINPSVELALDRDSLVQGVNPLNEDGKKIVAGLNLKGKNINDVVEQLIGAATEKQYLKPGADNVIMSSVVPAGKSDAPGIDDIVRQSIEASLQKENLKAEVAVLDAPPNVREEAQKAGISTGRYMLYLDARDRGQNVTPDDFKNKSIRLIEREQRINISEMARDKVVPGQSKKDRDNPGRPVEENSSLKPGSGGRHYNPGANGGKDKKAKYDLNNSGKEDKTKNDTGQGSVYKPGGWGSGGLKQRDPGEQDEKGTVRDGGVTGKGQDMSGNAPGGRTGKEDRGKEDKGGVNVRGGGEENHGSSGSAVSGSNGESQGGAAGSGDMSSGSDTGGGDSNNRSSSSDNGKESSGTGKNNFDNGHGNSGEEDGKSLTNNGNDKTKD